MHTLTDANPGTFLVTTASGSSYRIDTVARTAVRIPRHVAPVLEFADASLDMRKDAEQTALMSILACEVGSPLKLALGSVDDYVGYAGTVRLATSVTSIEPVSV